LYHDFLADLKSTEIASINVKRTVISDQSLIVPIVKALNRKQWFSGDPGLSVNYLTLEIFKENGTRTKFLLKYHKQDQSLVLNFVDGPKHSFFNG